MRVSRIELGIVLGLLLALSGRVTAQQEDVELTARTHFAAGEYRQALDIYAKLYAETLHPTYLRNVGRCYQNMGEPDKAISSFREYLRKAENLDPKHRAEVEGFIREMEDLKRQGAAAASPPVGSPSPASPPVSVVTSPVPLLALPAASDRAGDSGHVEVALTSGAKPSEDRGSSPFYKRWWLWTAVTAAAAGGVATALALSTGGTATPQATTTFGNKMVIPK